MRIDALIISYPHSGTHCLLNALGSHSHVNRLGEFFKKEIIPINDAKFNIGILMYDEVVPYILKHGNFSKIPIFHLRRETEAMLAGIVKCQKERRAIKWDILAQRRRFAGQRIEDLIKETYRKKHKEYLARTNAFLSFCEHVFSITYEELTKGQMIGPVDDALAAKFCEFMKLPTEKLAV